MTARTKYRGLVKRRLVPVAIDGTPPPPGTPILREGREVGTMRSSLGSNGLAVVRLDALRSALTSLDATITPMVPQWMKVGLP